MLLDPLKNRWIPLSSLFVILGLTSVHVYVKTQGTAYAGILLAVDHLFDLAITLLLLAICAGVGRLILAMVSKGLLTGLEELTFALAIGSGCVSLLILMLGATFAFSALTITCLLGLCLLLARREILTLPHTVRLAYAELTANTGLFTRAILAIVAGFMVYQALLPPTDWDTLMYHLRVPAQLLHTGRLFVPEDNQLIAFVQLAHMLYLPLLAFGSPSGPTLLSVAFSLVLGLAVFAFARRFFDNQTANFSIQLLWSSTIILVVAITPRIDVTIALFLFLAHFALQLSTHNMKFFYLSAALLGFAFGVKYTGIVYALALTPVILWIAFSRQKNIAASLRSLYYFATIALGVSLPWIVKNWWLLGSPLYPLFAEIKVDPWLAFLYPEKVLFSASAYPKMLTTLAEVRLPFNLIDLFVQPSVLTVESEAVFYRFSPLFLILIFWFISLTKSTIVNGLIIPPISYLITLIAFSPRTNLRYLIPVLAPLTVVSVHILVSRLMSRNSLRTMVVVVHLFVLLTLFPTANMMKIFTGNKLGFEYLIGKASYEDYLYHTAFPPGYGFFAPSLAYVNQNLPPTSRVLMLFEARGFHFKVPVIQDNVFTNWPLLANRVSTLDCLSGSRITHMLVNFGAMNYLVNRGLNPATTQWHMFNKFAESCLVQVFQGPGLVLYKVRR